MHIAAVAWFIFLNGLSFCCSFFSALSSPAGLRVSSTPLTSANDSRRRESARRMSGPKMKPTTASSAPAAKITSTSWLPLPPPRPSEEKNALRHRMLASRAAMPIMVPTTSRRRMSWFLMWLISWLATPSSSSRFMMASSPVVKVMAALSGLTPVAKALGEGSSIT